jgi:hypothetical protein
VAARPRTHESALAELLHGARTLAREPHPRLLVLLAAAQSFTRGLLNVLLVVVALDLLDVGDSGLGWLNSALGAGGLIGGVVTVGLVARRRLAAPFGFSLVLWGAPIALVAAWSHFTWALLCVGIVGLGNALLDVSLYTLLQRTVDEHVLGRVLGVMEVLLAAGVALGSVLGSVQVDQIGIRGALVVSGLFLPALAMLSYRGLRKIDDASSVPERELALVSAVPLFSPLPPNTLERLAFRMLEVKARKGATIVAQGTPGELFYVIASGTVDVLRDGKPITELGPGDYFGEIALLHNIDRTAACVAHTDVELYALNRESFVAAVGGDLRSTGTAEDVMTRRLRELGTQPAS